MSAARLLRRLADELPPFFVTPADRQTLLSLAREVERVSRSEDETREVPTPAQEPQKPSDGAR